MKTVGYIIKITVECNYKQHYKKGTD